MKRDVDLYKTYLRIYSPPACHDDLPLKFFVKVLYPGGLGDFWSPASKEILTVKTYLI